MMNNRIPEVGKEERRTLSVLVDNKPGVLSQIARLFTRNGYNIESFAADTVLDPGVTRITIEVIANDNHTNRIVITRNVFPKYILKDYSRKISHKNIQKYKCDHKKSRYTLSPVK